jgi:rhodanese-related sulfurtransferase
MAVVPSEERIEMKSKLAVLVVGALFLALTGCSSEEAPDKPQGDQFLQIAPRTNANVQQAAAPEIPTIDATTLKKRIDAGERATIVCTRSSDAQPLIKGAIRVDEDSILTWADKVPKTTFLAVYCTCPEDQAAVRAVRQLRDNGYENAYVIERGVKAWIAAGGPVTGGTAPAKDSTKPPTQPPAKSKQGQR